MGKNSYKPETARGEATRQKLLQAARKLFAKQGYARTGVSDITRRARVAQGTFYLYFPDKKAILRELVLGFSHNLRSRLREAMAKEPTRRAKEVAGFRAFLQFAGENPDLYPIVMESQFVDPAIYRDYYDSLRNAYMRALEKAQQAGEIRPVNLALAAYLLMGLGHFFGLDAIFWKESSFSDASIEEAIDMVMQGLAVK